VNHNWFTSTETSNLNLCITSMWLVDELITCWCAELVSRFRFPPQAKLFFTQIPFESLLKRCRYDKFYDALTSTFQGNVMCSIQIVLVKFLQININQIGVAVSAMECHLMSRWFYPRSRQSFWLGRYWLTVKLDNTAVLNALPCGTDPVKQCGTSPSSLACQWALIRYCFYISPPGRIDTDRRYCKTTTFPRGTD
jgi:hypothetical protein